MRPVTAFRIAFLLMLILSSADAALAQPCPPTVAPVPGGPSGTISNRQPTFRWSAVPGATSYTLYVLRVSDEATVVRQTNILGTSFTPGSPLPTDVDLRWKVKGESSCGPGPYSANVYFRVSTAPCPPTAVPVPGGPSGTISNSRPTFTWTAVPDAASYTFYVLRVSDEATVLRQTNILGTSFTPGSPLPSRVDLRWKVKGESSCGPGPYSPSVYFTIQPPVRITAPAQGATVSGTVDVTVSASDEITRVEFYVDGVLQSTDTTPPYEYAWDTTANPLPVPDHPIDYGYYFVDGRYGDYRSEVNDYTNLYHSWARRGYEPSAEAPDEVWLPLMQQGLANAAAENRRITLALNLQEENPARVTPLDAVLDIAAPYWSYINRIELADEPGWTRAETEARIQDLIGRLQGRGLAHRPMGNVYDYRQPLPDAINAYNLDWVGIEAYLDPPGSPNSQTNVANLNNHLAQAKSAVPAGKQILLVMMAYDRNGSWSNIDTLRDLQIPVYLQSYNDPRVTAITMFSYGRPGGSRDHPELKTPHRLIGEQILGISIPGAGNGPRTLTAEGFDAGGMSAMDRVTVTVSN